MAVACRLGDESEKLIYLSKFGYKKCLLRYVAVWVLKTGGFGGKCHHHHQGREII
jgi:hypothetical protein